VSDLRQVLWTALAYPLIPSLSPVFSLLALVLVKVVPQVGELFAGFEVKIPVLDRGAAGHLRSF